jgi:dTDP-4-amino-4,6-dideoxygalactose transaminase
MSMKIPFVDLKAQYKTIQPEIQKALEDVFEQSAYIQGPKLEAFEKAFAQFCDAPYCAGVGSGTDALYLALRALGIGPGDEVITVANTYIATVEAISFTGAKPVFVDVEPESQLIDLELLPKAVTSKTKVVIPVHLYGQICDMEAILSIARKHNLVVLEDAAQAHAAEFRGKKSPISSIAAYSFYPGKNLGAYGDAGAVVTHDRKVYEYILQQRDHGRRQGAKYEHDQVGFGFRLDTLQAAVLGTKLPHLKKWTELRRKHGAHYSKRLKDYVKIPFEFNDRIHVYHVYAIRTPQRDQLREYLESKGVSTNIHYPIPVHLQKAYASLEIRRGSLPVTESASEQLLSLPMYPDLSEAQIDYICDHIAQFFESKKQKQVRLATNA